MIWLAGFALAFFIVALCFVSMGFLRTDLETVGTGAASSSLSLPSSSLDPASAIRAGAVSAPAVDQQAMRQPSPAASGRPEHGAQPADTGIRIIQRSVRDILSSAQRTTAQAAQAASDTRQQSVPQVATAPRIATVPVAAQAAPAAAQLSTSAAVSSGRKVLASVVPRLKPLRDAVDRTLAANASADTAVPHRAPATSIDVNAPFLADNIRLGFADERDFSGGAEAVFTKSPLGAPVPYQHEAMMAGEEKLVLRRGESLASALARVNLRRPDINAAIEALSGEIDLRAMKPGTEISLSLIEPSLTVYQRAALENSDAMPPRALAALSLPVDTLRRLEVYRDGTGRLQAEIHVAETDRRYAAVSGTITDSLFASAARAGMPHPVAAKLSNMFLYDVDFQREIHEGDQFEAVYEVFYDDAGNIVDYGDVLFGRMSWRGGAKERGYYRFEQGSEITWFDAAGASARRMLMKTPIEGARITSGFGKRHHPVLGYTKAHKGTDFGASSGTPIMAAGDGVIERANVFSTYGNYVRIRHEGGFETAYAHLKGFASGIRAGARVRQGDIIGYVGTTGRSTGPHLHYEVLKEGQQVNPMTVKVAMGTRLDGTELERFRQDRAWIDELRHPLRLSAAG